MEMEKILVINGIGLLEFTFELMTSIYHFTNIMSWALIWYFFSQIGLLEDHSGLGKYQGNTLACLCIMALAVATPHWISYSNTVEGVELEI